MDFLKNLLSGAQNLFYNIGGGAKAEAELAQQQRLRAEQDLATQMEIARRQQAGTLTPQQYQTAQTTPTSIYSVPLSTGGGGEGEADWDAQWYSKHAGEGERPPGYHGESGDSGGGSFSENLLQAFVDPVSQAIQAWHDRLTEFDKNNPFAFDEALARSSAEERLNPYYDAELNDYMTGYRRSSQRSLEDMTRTIGELNADASQLSERERFATQEAIRSSEEGFAGAGLFFSGQRARTTGVNEVAGIQTQGDIQTALGRDVMGKERANARTQEDIALQQARTQRLTEAERTTALETDVSGQKKEEAYKRGLEQLAYAGQAPGLDALNRMQLENTFLSRLG